LSHDTDENKTPFPLPSGNHILKKKFKQHYMKNIQCNSIESIEIFLIDSVTRIVAIISTQARALALTCWHSRQPMPIIMPAQA